jgi:crossover junction endodeoxyribonuclease RuvC
MIALGVDPGTRNLGWGVVSRTGNQLRHVAHGVIRAGGDESLSVRLHTIFDQLEGVLGQHRPAVGSVEGIFFDKNAQSAAKLGHARGVVLLCLQRHGVTVREHSPARVKRTLTGNGQAAKAQVAQMVKALLGLELLPPSDAADALALALTELRLDPRAHDLEALAKKRPRSQIPTHLAEAIARTRARRGR